MKRLSSILLTLLAPAALIAGLKWDKTLLELPAEAGQEKLVGVFHFTNDGDEPVSILKTHSSCGCTVPELQRKTYAPGESGELKAVFTVGNRTGPQRKTLTVVTDDPTHPMAQLVLQTDIPELVSIRPKMVLWRIGNEADWKEVTLTTDPLNRVIIPEDDRHPEHQLIAVEGEPGTYTLRLKPASTQKRHNFELPIHVRLPDGKTYFAKVFMLVR